MLRLIRRYIVLIFVLISVDTFAQNSQIAAADAFLSKVATYSYNDLLLLSAKVRYREKIIEGLQQDIAQLNKDIRNLRYSVSYIDKRIDAAKKQYEIIIKFYQRYSTNYDIFAFIFSADDFRQAYNRIMFISGIANQRRNAIVNLKKFRHQKKVEMDKLQKLLNVKQKLSRKLKNQETLNAADKDLLNLQVQLFTSDAEKVKIIWEKDSLASAARSRTIKRFIDSQSINRPDNSFDIGNDKDELTRQFAKLQGFLQWPVTNGVVIRSFGTYKHPVLKSVTVRNDGIDISTDKNAEIHAVAGGVVSSVIEVPGFNNSVIIKHGHFYSVYSNLDKVSVDVNQIVDRNQVIGTVAAGDDDSFSVLNFQLWYNDKKLNPELWLKAF